MISTFAALALPTLLAAQAATPPPPVGPTTPPLVLEQSLVGIKGQGALQATLELVSEGKPLGAVHCDLFADKAPQGVAAFVGLARGLVAFKDPHPQRTGWQKKPFYDGLPVHRVIGEFLIQSGDPKCFGDAQCMFTPGSGDPGFALPDEVRPELRFDQGGVLAMASRGPNTAGSQFFITVKAAPWLSGQHTIFGQCDNLPLLDQVSRLETYSNDAPKVPVVIQRLTVTRKNK
ncbi:MAG TPA: peptidylprolyl isomerase [Pseudomonadota bacterium]|nr:peptidylprolyl isomerase [Pseudomonadota bacterium]